MSRILNYTTWIVSMATLITFTGCKTEEDVPLPTIVEKDFENKYRGTWTSATPTATFTAVVISAILIPVGDNNLSGELFISHSFVSCCSSGNNDGTVSIQFDGNQITSFSYADTIINCTGFFSGTGTIKTDGSLSINFTGSDCDGEHSNGVMILNKL